MRKEAYFSSDWIMYRAAELFYIKGIQQKDISRELNISTVTVSRLIQKAKEAGVIHFQITDPYEKILMLSEQVKERYGLKDVIISLYPNPRRPELMDAKQAVALEGAKYLQRRLTGSDIVGIAWGGTMFHLINDLNPCQRSNASFVTMHGSIANCDYELDVQTLTARAAMALGGTKYSLLMNGLLSSCETVEQLKKERNIQKIFQLFEKITISVSGIGSFYPEPTSLLARENYITRKEFQSLREQDVRGDIMLRFFDKNGNECENGLKGRTLSIGLDVYKKIKTKILVVSGTEKTGTLHTALKSGFCDILIIDDGLAEAILEYEE